MVPRPVSSRRASRLIAQMLVHVPCVVDMNTTPAHGQVRDQPALLLTIPSSHGPRCGDDFYPGKRQPFTDFDVGVA